MQQVKERILRFMGEQQYPDQAVESLTIALDKVLSCQGKEIFEDIIQKYQADYRISAEATGEKIKQISLLAGIDERECNQVVYMGLADILKQHYINRGFPLENYNDTIRELKCKLLECHNCFGVWGARTNRVMNTHFAMTRFGMGVFQFEIIKLPLSVEINGVKLQQGDKVINIHIPMLGVPLTAEARKQSYLKAKEFFKGQFPDADRIPFYCHTWLLFKRHKEILKPDSNIVSFMNDFDVLIDYDYPDYAETWRFFGKQFTTLEEMPKTNSIQKAYAKIIERGEKTGGAEGIFLI